MSFNSVTTAITAARKKFREQPQNGVYHWIDKWQAKAGQFAKELNQSLPVDKDGVIAILCSNANTSLPRVLTFRDAEILAKQIENLTVGSDHLNVKNSSNWKRIYQAEDRNFPFMDSLGNVDHTIKQIETIPCHNCGVVVLFSMVQVDHHMPQAGGEDLYTLKIARALGLTENGPTGGKGNAILANSLGTLNLYPKGREMGNYDHIENNSAKEKWTTNERGVAFFSLFAAIKALDDVKKRCKNTILNLVPLCGECNRQKSDYVKPRA